MCTLKISSKNDVWQPGRVKNDMENLIDWSVNELTNESVSTWVKSKLIKEYKWIKNIVAYE